MLPKIEQPYYNTELPMSKEKVKYRPYLMKEQKIILIANEGDEEDDVVQAITQIIHNCTDGKVDARTLNAVDAGYLMAKIRSASEGAVIDVNMRCKKIINDVECGHVTPMSVDISEMVLSGEYKEELTKINIVDGIGIKLKAPSIEFFNFVNRDSDSIVDALPLLIDYIYDSEGQMFRLENETEESVTEFFDSLSGKNIADITKFVDEMPKLVVEIPFTCEECGHSEVVKIQDIQDFLG